MGNIRSSTFRKARRRISRRLLEMQRISNRNQSSLVIRLATLFTCAWAFIVRLHAAAVGNLPWGRPMQTIAPSLTGPAAYADGLLGIALAAGVMLVVAQL